MLNLLIIDKDVYNSTNLLNHISKNNSHIRVYSIVKDLEEGIKTLNTGLIDITLIHLDDEIDSIIDNINTISNVYSEKYKKSIIVLSRKPNNIKQSPYIYEYVSSSEDLSIIISKINQIAKNKMTYFDDPILLNKINKELEYIGYNLSYNGTKYLADCISIAYYNYDSSKNLSKNLYSILSKKYHKSIDSIKSNITIATISMYYECDENRLKDYFLFYTPDKPSPKLVIHTVLNKLLNTI